MFFSNYSKLSLCFIFFVPDCQGLCGHLGLHVLKLYMMEQLLVSRTTNLEQTSGICSRFNPLLNQQFSLYNY